MTNPGTFKKGEKRPNQGRPKGCKNKTTQTALEAIAQAAEELGGTERLAAWAKEAPENEKVFWGTIYPKLLPLQVTGDKDNPINVVTKIVREIVRPNDTSS